MAQKKTKPTEAIDTLTLPITEDGRIEYTDVVKVDSTSKEELYSRAREWFVDSFKSSDDVFCQQCLSKSFEDKLQCLHAQTFILVNLMIVNFSVVFTIGRNASARFRPGHKIALSFF